MVIEAMKMEHTITAPYAGTVRAIHFERGARVPGRPVRVDPAEPWLDPASVVAEAASRAESVGGEERGRRALVDSVGDAAAVVAALLQSSGGPW